MPEKPNIRFACMSLMWGSNLPGDKMLAWLEDVKRAGYDGIATFEGDLLRYVAETDFVERINDMNLPLASIDYFVQEDYEHLRKVCELLQQLNCQHMVTIGGIAQKGADMQKVADVLNKIGSIALEYGVKACYHNHTDHTGETYEDVQKLMSLVDRKVFFGFVDTGHATKDFIEYPVADRAAIYVEQNKDWVDFIEFKDWTPEFDLKTEVGAGLCDYKKVFKVLKDMGYRGWITIEQNGTNGTKTPYECAKASIDFIRKGLGL